ncbi:Chloride channel protein [Arachis hypogaea]|nr:Chloride channel protein [Arachis hypogaea]
MVLMAMQLQRLRTMLLSGTSNGRLRLKTGKDQSFKTKDFLSDGSGPVHSSASLGERKFSLDGFIYDLESPNLSPQSYTAMNILERFSSIHTPTASKLAYGVNLLQEGEENIGQFLYLEGIDVQRDFAAAVMMHDPEKRQALVDG